MNKQIDRLVYELYVLTEERWKNGLTIRKKRIPGKITFHIEEPTKSETDRKW